MAPEEVDEFFSTIFFGFSTKKTLRISFYIVNLSNFPISGNFLGNH